MPPRPNVPRMARRLMDDSSTWAWGVVAATVVAILIFWGVVIWLGMSLLDAAG
jgi:hypothetical protein